MKYLVLWGLLALTAPVLADAHLSGDPLPRAGDFKPCEKGDRLCEFFSAMHAVKFVGGVIAAVAWQWPGAVAEANCATYVDRATEGDGFAFYPGQYQALGCGARAQPVPDS